MSPSRPHLYPRSLSLLVAGALLWHAPGTVAQLPSPEPESAPSASPTATVAPATVAPALGPEGEWVVTAFDAFGEGLVLPRPRSTITAALLSGMRRTEEAVDFALAALAIVPLPTAGWLSWVRAASVAPPGLDIGFEALVEGLDSPVLLVGAGDGSGERYVVEQGGRVVVIDAHDRLRGEPLLDISDRVYMAEERGLLGLALHPAFTDDGRLFVAYTRPGDGATVISAFSRPPRVAPAASDTATSAAPAAWAERPLLVIAQPYTRHKGGMLAFDRDGMLLLSTGDGGSGNDPMGHGLDRASLLGKLLRIDVDRGWPYAIPRGNGFEGDLDARAEVHAMGLRNPWRFSVDRLTGDVYVGDVGQGAWEEIDVLRRGDERVSFGWGEMEGPGCLAADACDRDAHRLPSLWYPHQDGGTTHCAVIGGYAYRGPAGTLPAGTYLFADHCSGTIWAVPVDALVAGDAEPVTVARLDPTQGQIQAFGQDDAGELYVLTSAGGVLRIVPARDATG